jgi:hypothetical protein
MASVQLPDKQSTILGVVSSIENFPTADVAPRAEWISVEERLPEVAGRAYLVWDDVQKTVKKRFFYRIPPSIPLETYPYIREYFGNSADYKRYTHWMPLPEPPKGAVS